jgi:hypothetical protein
MGARMGTAMRPGSRAGLGPLNTNIQVAERPVTQQGMMGMKPVSQGPGRQIQDRSYYMGELRKRCDELQGEINKMNGEAEQYNKDNETYTKFEKKYNTLISEVRKLQGDLADLNLIADKSRNGTDPQDIDNAYQHLKQVVQPRLPSPGVRHQRCCHPFSFVPAAWLSTPAAIGGNPGSCFTPTLLMRRREEICPRFARWSGLRRCPLAGQRASGSMLSPVC